MTFEQRVTAIQGLGFSARQARFLVIVLMHAGVCIVRQYCEFSGIARGQVTADFFGRLVSARYATPYADAHRTYRVYHLQHRALYAAIGEPHSRFRKPTPLAAAIERLMLLDGVLSRPDVLWFASERDKLAHFTKLLGTSFGRDDLPRFVFGRAPEATVRFFPDKLPIGLESDGSTHVFVYLVTRPEPMDFRAFLQRHAELARALTRWRIWILVPRHLAAAEAAYGQAAWEELASPLRPAIADELQWFFTRVAQPPTSKEQEWRRWVQARRAFGAPRYRALYRTWLKVGRSCVDATISHTLADALERGAGRVEPYVLSRTYLHLWPVVGTA